MFVWSRFKGGHLLDHVFLTWDIENSIVPIEGRGYYPFPFPNGNLQHLLILEWKKKAEQDYYIV